MTHKNFGLDFKVLSSCLSFTFDNKIVFRFGPVAKIVTFNKNSEFQGFVQYVDQLSAMAALNVSFILKVALHYLKTDSSIRLQVLLS